MAETKPKDTLIAAVQFHDSVKIDNVPMEYIGEKHDVLVMKLVGAFLHVQGVKSETLIPVSNCKYLTLAK